MTVYDIDDVFINKFDSAEYILIEIISDAPVFRFKLYSPEIYEINTVPEYEFRNEYKYAGGKCYEVVSHL